MGCCGHKRAAASASLRRTVSAPAVSQGQRPTDVSLRYLGAKSVRVRGTASGRVYLASSANAAFSVDARDAAALVRTGLFRAVH
jgi:hypothetical protein